MRRSGPIAENLLRDVGAVASKVSCIEAQRR